MQSLNQRIVFPINWQNKVHKVIWESVWILSVSCLMCVICARGIKEEAGWSELEKAPGKGKTGLQ